MRDHCGDFLGAVGAITIGVLAFDAAALASVTSPNGSDEMPNGPCEEFVSGFARIDPRHKAGQGLD
jgi:hypothetical protein